jgi:hypothetical protein
MGLYFIIKEGSLLGMKMIGVLVLFTAVSVARAVVMVDVSGTHPGGTGETGYGLENYVGQIKGASGIYLGNGWVLTAAHVGAGTFTLNGASYEVIADSAVSFYNASGMQADLTLFQIAGLTGEGISLYSGSLVDSELYLLGYGGGVFGWGTATIPNNSFYTHDANDPKLPYFSETFVVPSYSYNSINLYSGNALAISGDSGGGVFIYDDYDGEWKLAGVMVLAGTVTLGADMNVYGADILAAMTVPEPSVAMLMAAGLGILLITGKVRRKQGFARLG